MRLLVVEDEPQLGRQLQTALQSAGFAVDLTDNGIDGEHLGATEPYDAIVLDIGLPGRDGLSVLARWRTPGPGMRSSSAQAPWTFSEHPAPSPLPPTKRDGAGPGFRG